MFYYCMYACTHIQYTHNTMHEYKTKKQEMEDARPCWIIKKLKLKNAL